MEVLSSNMEVKRVLRRQTQHHLRKVVVKNAVFSLSDALPVAHFCCFMFENPALASRTSSKHFENTSLKTVHVKLSGAHSDNTEHSFLTMNLQE